MSLATFTTNHMLLKRSNGDTKPYQFRDQRLALAAQRVFDKYKELKKFPEPPQNPLGLREIDQRAVALAGFIYDQLRPLEKVAVAKEFDASKYAISCPNEDGFLAMAIVSPPPLLDWAPENSNKTELANSDRKSDRLVATLQHFYMVARMIDHGTFVFIIEHDLDAKQMVFVRDVVFAMDDKLYLANLLREDRLAEKAKFGGNLVAFPQGAVIEGGNVILLGDDAVLVGINQRTNMNAYEELKSKTGRKVFPVPISDDVIHLDCIFLPKEANGGPSLAFFYPKMFKEPEKAYQIISSRYNNVEVIPDSEFKGVFGANVLKLDAESWLVNPKADEMASKLEKAKIKPDVLEFSEITMSEAGYRCCYAATARFAMQ